MRRTVAVLPLALLFIASIAPSLAQTGGGASGGGDTRVLVQEGAPLRLQCVLRPEQRAQWRRDGLPPPPELRAHEAAAAGGVAARLEAPSARPQHAGRYTCADDAPALLLEVAPRRAAAADADASVHEVVYEVKGNLSLNCTLKSAANLPYVWTKNETRIEDVPELKERYVLEQGGAVWKIIGRSNEDDAGNYSCSVGTEPLRFDVRSRAIAKIPANTNVVEGQRLKLTCRLIGKPYPEVSWLFSNSSDVNATDIETALGSAVSLRVSEQGVVNGELVIEVAARSHAGVFTCVPLGGIAASTTLRVKDMYAALWPFLGICAEVIVLCAIILIYERRRTKPELDDSDTDNHDQKKS